MRDHDQLFPALMHAILRLSSIRACCYCFAAAVARIFSSGPRFPDPHSQVANARTIKGRLGIQLRATEGEQYAGRKCDSRTPKPGSRFLELPMVGIRPQRQQSPQTNRLGYCGAVARPIVRSPNDHRTDAGNQCHRHPDGWNIHNGGTVG